MADLATLGIRVNTGDLKEGATALSTLTTRGEEAERATRRLGTVSATSGAKVAAFGTQMRGATGHTANLTAQLNDIGIMMAAGQNPLQLALQQGTQINQVFAQLGGGRGAIRAVGAAFMSLLSPINLATIGIIAFGGAAVNWLMQSRREAENLEEVTDRLSDSLASIRDAADMASMSISELTEQYGSNAVAARENIREILELRKAIASQGLRDAVDGLGDAFDDVFGTGTTRRNSGAIELANTFGITAEQAKILVAEAENLKSAVTFDEQQQSIQSIGQALEDWGVPLEKLPAELLDGLRNAAELEDVMLAIEAAIDGSAAAARNLSEAMEMTRGPGIFNPLLDETGEVLPGEQLLPGYEPAKPTRGRRGGGGGRIRQDPNESRAQQIMDNARTAAERYADELTEINELTAEGYLTDEQRMRAINSLGTEMENVSGIARQMEGAFARTFTSFITGTQSAREALEGLLNNLANVFANEAFASLVSGGGGGGGGLLGNLFGNLFGGARADGGPVSAGKSYLVGERGPELFTPGKSGGITPNNAMNQGGEVLVRVMVNEAPSFASTVRAEATGTAVRVVQEYDKRQAPAMVQRSLNDPRRRG